MVNRWLINGRKFRSQTSDNMERYGEMEKQRWEESERRRKEVRRSEKRKSERKEDAGARKRPCCIGSKRNLYFWSDKKFKRLDKFWKKCPDKNSHFAPLRTAPTAELRGL